MVSSGIFSFVSFSDIIHNVYILSRISSKPFALTVKYVFIFPAEMFNREILVSLHVW